MQALSRPVHSLTRKPGNPRPGIIASRDESSGETGPNDVLWMLPRRQMWKAHLRVRPPKEGYVSRNGATGVFSPSPSLGILVSKIPRIQAQ